MPDPVVHITNGIPDAGTGTITTLGQTLLDGASVTLGATTDLTVAAGAAGTVNAHLRSISRDIAGGIVLQPGANVIGAVTQSGGPWSVSGSVSITGSVTVTGTVAATQSGTWNINNISGTITLPTGAATSAKQPALGTAGTPSLDVLTVQGAATMTPLKVDGSAVTQPISGNVGITGNVNCVQVTSPWVTSISGNVTCVQSGNWTSRVVGNAGGIFDFASTQNVATPAQALLIGAEFNAVPTTITTGNSSPLQLDSAANLLVNVKTGTVSATQSGTWTDRIVGNTGAVLDFAGQNAAAPANAILIGGEFNTTPTTIASGNASPFQLDSSGNLKVNIQAGAGSGGTASTVGGALPGQGTLAMGSVTTAAPSYTTATANALSLTTAGALRVDGSAVTQPVSGTFWQATQPISAVALPLPTGAATSANQPTNAAQGSATSGQTGNLSMGAVTTAAPTYTTTQTSPLSLTTAGALRVDGSGVTQPVSGTFWQATQPVSGTFWQSTQPVSVSTLPLPSGAATSANQPTNATQGSTTSGQTGNLSFGAVTTGAPTYTTAQSSPLSLTTAGALRVDGSAVTQPVSGTVGISGTVPVSGTFWQATQPVSIAAAVSVNATQTGNWTTRIVGNAGVSLDAAQNAAAPANELVVGGVYNSAAPTLTSGNASQLQLDVNGNLNVNIKAGAGSGGTASTVGGALPGQGTLAMGSVTTSAPSYTTATANALSLTTAGALRVDGSATTQPVSGTFWQTTQPVSVASLPLPTGAATSANQPSNSAIGATTSGQTGNLAMGAVTTAAPTYTTAQTNPLSLNTAGGLRVDGSGVTQPVSGTFWQATQPVSIAASVTVAQATSSNLNALVNPLTAANWGVGTSTQNSATVANGVLALAQFNTSPTAITSGNMSPLQMDGNGNLLVNVKAGASGGTSSTVGAATPTVGTLALGAVTTAAPSYTTATANSLSLTTAGALRVDGSGVTQPVSGTFWQATQPVSIAAAVTVTQATAANLQATVTGTVAATQSGNWTTRIVGNAGGILDFAGQNAASPGSAQLMGGQYNSTPTAITSGNSSPLQLDANGNLKTTMVPQITTPAAWTSATGVNATNLFPYASTILGALVTTSTITAGAVTFEESYDNGATWVSIPTARLINPATGATLANPYTLVASTNQPFQIITTGTTQIRARLSTAITGTGSATFTVTSSPFLNEIQIFQSNAAELQATVTGSVSVSGTANVNVTNASIAVTGTFWQATQPVSGTVTVQQATASNLNANVSGTVTANQGGTWNINNISGAISLPTGAATSANQCTAAAQGSTTSGQTGHLAMGAVTTGAPSYTTAQTSPLSLTTTGALRVDGSAVTQPVSGTFWQATQPVSGTVSISGSVAVTGTFWQATQPVSIAATVATGGDTASGASDAGNPVKIGAVGHTAIPTAVTDGQRVNLTADKVGKLLTAGAIRTQKGVQKTSITVNTETTVVTAGGAGVFNDVYAIVVTNKSATGVFVDFRDSTAGTVRLTLAAPANDTRGFTVPVDSAMVQATAANNWTATVSAAVTSIEIAVLYVGTT